MRGKYKIIFLVHGLGEFAQASGFANYLQKKVNARLLFLIDKNEHLIKACQDLNFFYLPVNKKNACAIIEKNKPDILILNNSTTTNNLINKKPRYCHFIISFDSNWLFNKQLYTKHLIPFSWVDYHFIVMPKKIFETGLKKNGGHYQISSNYKRKIVCPGFIPTPEIVTKELTKKWRKKIKVSSKEKLVVTYFGRGITYNWFLLPLTVTIIKEIRRYQKIKLINFGPEKIKESWCINYPWVSDKEFQLALASADLFIQHHGITTLTKAIRYQIPTITFVSDFSYATQQAAKISPSLQFKYFEIEPFHRLNLCRLLHVAADRKTYQKTFFDLLFERKIIKNMKQAQKKFWQSGEENIWQLIKNYIK